MYSRVIDVQSLFPAMRVCTHVNDCQTSSASSVIDLLILIFTLYRSVFVRVHIVTSIRVSSFANIPVIFLTGQLFVIIVCVCQSSSLVFNMAAVQRAFSSVLLRARVVYNWRQCI